MKPTRFINKKNLYRIKAGSFSEFLYERDSALLEDSTEDKEIRARIKIQKAILWININRGFFGQLLANLNVYGSSDPNYPTMATNGLSIQYHPDFVLGQSDAAIRFVLCHEILHCVGEHMSRRGNRNPLLWNYATDYAINPILNAEVVAEDKGKGKNDKFAWPKNPDGTQMGLFKEKYEGMRAEDIYDDILQDPELQKVLKQMPKETNFGEVVDADQDLGEPDSDSSIAQEIMGDEEGEGQPQPGFSGTPSSGQPKPGDGEELGEKKPEDSESQQNLIGKKVRVTEGPEKGKIGIVKQVLPNGDIIIE